MPRSKEQRRAAPPAHLGRCATLLMQLQCLRRKVLDDVAPSAALLSKVSTLHQRPIFDLAAVADCATEEIRGDPALRSKRRPHRVNLVRELSRLGPGHDGDAEGEKRGAAAGGRGRGRGGGNKQGSAGRCALVVEEAQSPAASASGQTKKAARREAGRTTTHESHEQPTELKPLNSPGGGGGAGSDGSVPADALLDPATRMLRNPDLVDEDHPLSARIAALGARTLGFIAHMTCPRTRNRRLSSDNAATVTLREALQNVRIEYERALLDLDTPRAIAAATRSSGALTIAALKFDVLSCIRGTYFADFLVLCVRCTATLVSVPEAYKGVRYEEALNRAVSPGLLHVVQFDSMHFVRERSHLPEIGTRGSYELQSVSIPNKPFDMQCVAGVMTHFALCVAALHSGVAESASTFPRGAVGILGMGGNVIGNCLAHAMPRRAIAIVDIEPAVCRSCEVMGTFVPRTGDDDADADADGGDGGGGGAGPITFLARDVSKFVAASESAAHTRRFFLLFLDCFNPHSGSMMHAYSLIKNCKKMLCRGSGVLAVNAHVAVSTDDTTALVPFVHAFGSGRVHAVNIRGCRQTIIVCIRGDDDDDDDDDNEEEEEEDEEAKHGADCAMSRAGASSGCTQNPRQRVSPSFDVVAESFRARIEAVNTRLPRLLGGLRLDPSFADGLRDVEVDVSSFDPRQAAAPRGSSLLGKETKKKRRGEMRPLPKAIAKLWIAEDDVVKL